MKKRYLNSQSAIEFLCCFVSCIVLLYLVCSGQYLSYVTPRIKPYLLITAVVLAVWCIQCMTKLFEAQYRKRVTHCFVLLIPFLILLLPHDVSAAASFTKGFTGGTGNTLTASGSTGIQTASSSVSVSSSAAPAALSVSSAGKTAVSGTTKSADGYLTKDMYGQSVEIHGYDKVHKTIRISNKDFYLWTITLYKNLNQFIGYQVTVTGRVYKDSDTLKFNQFVPARLLMTCCTADLQPCGLLCESNQTSSLQKDSWVTVTGKIIKGDYHGEPEPHIHVTHITSAKPIQGYVYPA